MRSRKVLLFGDYDVDGTTAVAMMHTFLKDTLLHSIIIFPIDTGKDMD